MHEKLSEIDYEKSSFYFVFLTHCDYDYYDNCSVLCSYYHWYSITLSLIWNAVFYCFVNEYKQWNVFYVHALPCGWQKSQLSYRFVLMTNVGSVSPLIRFNPPPSPPKLSGLVYGSAEIQRIFRRPFEGPVNGQHHRWTLNTRNFTFSLSQCETDISRIGN